MNRRVMMAAFFDELEKIGEAEMEKRASPARVAYELRKEANWLSRDFLLNLFQLDSF